MIHHRSRLARKQSTVMTCLSPDYDLDTEVDVIL